MENYFWQQKLVPFQEQPMDFFVLSEVEKNHVRTKRGFHNQLMYAILLKYFESERQFPDGSIQILPFAHEILAKQLDVPFEELKWPAERTLKRFRASVRKFLRYREMTSIDKTDLSSWLSKNILPHAPDEDELFEAAEFFCRTHRVELFAKWRHCE